jgi:hypothetical protein
MPDYKKMYFVLMDAVTCAIGQLQNAQLEGENAYVESETIFSPLQPPREE